MWFSGSTSGRITDPHLLLYNCFEAWQRVACYRKQDRGAGTALEESRGGYQRLTENKFIGFIL